MYAERPLPPGYGNTTKQTYVTTDTSDRMPDYCFRDGSVDETVEVDSNGHRIKKKYTTTTVTTVTTTTILLPKMQSAYVYDPVTRHFEDRQPGVGGDARAGPVPPMLTNGRDSEANGQLTAVRNREWNCNQDNERYVHEGAPQPRPPTLQELGISSYFDRNPYHPVKGAICSARYTRGSESQPKPWVMDEAFAEVEGGMGAY